MFLLSKNTSNCLQHIPKHWIEFFNLIRAINFYCFPGSWTPKIQKQYAANWWWLSDPQVAWLVRIGLSLQHLAYLKVDNRQFKFDIRTRMWASEHNNHDVEGAGLNIPVCVAAVHMKPSPSVLQVLIEVFATTIKICTLMRILCLSFHQECTPSAKLVQSVTLPTRNIKAVCDIEL
jgi:hypothetical protein